MLRHKYFSTKSRILLIVIATFLSVLIDLLVPAQVPAQETILVPGAPFTYQQQTISVLPRFQGNIIRQVKINSEKKVIALTFDDGPTSNITPQVLATLRKYNIKATFFLIGKNLKKYPKIAQQIVADGHTLGNHTWHHWRKLMTEFTASREIEDTADVMYEITGVQTCLFRPPNGFLYNGLVGYALKKKDAVVLWSVDSQDWRGSKTSVDKLVNRIVEKVKPGAIVLMHDGGGDRSRTVQALPRIIEELTKQGYKFVRVPKLLEMQDSEFKTGPAV